MTFWNSQNNIYLWNSKSEVIVLSPKTGRPKAENPKCNDIKVRLSDKQHEQLMEYCERHNITKAEAIRQGISRLLESEN